MTKDTLSEKIKGKYKLVGIEPGIIEFKGRTFDFRTIDVQKSEYLIQAGCQKIKKLPPVKKSKAGT